MINRIAAALCLLFLIGCGSDSSDEDVQEISLDAFCGRWHHTGHDNQHIEEWSKDTDQSLHGMGFVLAGSDTVFIEHLAMKPVDGVLNYVAQVSNQNENKPVYFKLLSKKRNRMVFENLQHDFPQRIIYELQSPSTMLAYIEGYEGSDFRQVKFSFEKTD